MGLKLFDSTVPSFSLIYFYVQLCMSKGFCKGNTRNCCLFFSNCGKENIGKKIFILSFTELKLKSCIYLREFDLAKHRHNDWQLLYL